MQIWQIDISKRPYKDQTGQILWELCVCDSSDTGFRYSSLCPQSEVNAEWLTKTLKNAQQGTLPDRFDVFRPQCLGLIETAGKLLGVAVQPNPHCVHLKTWLSQQNYQNSKYYTDEIFNPLAIERTPPTPAPIQGQQWRFAALNAADLIDAFTDLPIPILNMPKSLYPVNLGIASTTPVPGIIIDAGRQSMRLAQWLQETQPVALNYIAGSPDGLILEAGLAERWVLATFEDPEVTKAGQIYQQRKQKSHQLHFILIRPDDSGITYTGFWLLQNPTL